MLDSDPDPLLQRLRRGEAGAFDALVRQYAQGLYALAFSLLSNAHDAQDAVQDCFAAVTVSLPTFQGRSTLKTWLSGILINQARRIRRSRTVRKMSQISNHHPALSPAPDPRIDLLAMLDQLSEEHRQILVLRELQNLTYHEIAQALSLSPRTVESRIFRARQQLRLKLSAYAPPQPVNSTH